MIWNLVKVQNMDILTSSMVAGLELLEDSDWNVNLSYRCYSWWKSLKGEVD
jgi:hypothetical protein